MWYEQVTGLESNKPQAGALRFDSQLLDGAAALAGHSVAILNALLWQQQIQQGLLVPVLRRSAFGRGRYWLTSTKRQSEDRRVRAFATWIVAEARAAREWVKSLQAGCEGEEFCR
jgi:LysR family glycine cleavage system transcriptional activator